MQVEKGDYVASLEERINILLGDQRIDKNKISDGYHTFGELYEHRIMNFLTLAEMQARTNRLDFMAKLVDETPHSRPVWMSDTHNDGSQYQGWFLLGIDKRMGKQITYHLPKLSRENNYWDRCKTFAEILDKAPMFDGHTSSDVLARLNTYFQ